MANHAEKNGSFWPTLAVTLRSLIYDMYFVNSQEDYSISVSTSTGLNLNCSYIGEDMYNHSSNIHQVYTATPDRFRTFSFFHFH